MGSDRELTPVEKKMVYTHVGNFRDKITFAGVMAKIQEKKGKKKTKGEIILVVGKYRVYFFNASASKSAKKKTVWAHLLDVIEVASPSPTEIAFRVRTNPRPIVGETNKVDDIVKAILQTYHETFPSMGSAHRFPVHLYPQERLTELKKAKKKQDVGVCGGFIKTYKSICSYMQIPWRIDICWDVKHLLAPNHIRTVNLREFNFDNLVDFKAFIVSLRHNEWFKVIVWDGSPTQKLPKEAVISVADTMKYNCSIEELRISGCLVVKESIIAIGDALSFNRKAVIQVLDISNNPIEDKGAIAIAKWIKQTSRGLTHLDLSSCGIGTKGFSAIADALQKNVHHHNTLAKLAISNNKLDTDSSYAWGQALREMTVLTHFACGGVGSSVKLEPLMGALKKINNLEVLDLSGARLHVNTKSTQFFDLVNFIKSAHTLKELNLSRTNIPIETLLELLSNSMKIQALDVSENELGDKGLVALVDQLHGKNSFKKLILDRNFKQGKSKSREKAISSLISLVTQSPCKIETLSLAAGGKYGIKLDLVPFIQALSSNESITDLDISGHGFGDMGAVTLGKIIQQNQTLKSLKMDDNTISVNGFKAFSIGLERNKSLQSMPVPLIDINAITKEQPSPTLQAIIDRMQQKMFQNGQRILKTTPLASLATLEKAQIAEIAKLVARIEEFMGNVINPGKELKFEELEEQVKYLVGEEFLTKTVDQANAMASSFLFDKLYEQLDAIIVLSSLDETKTPEGTRKNYTSTGPDSSEFSDERLGDSDRSSMPQFHVQKPSIDEDEDAVDKILAEELSQKVDEPVEKVQKKEESEPKTPPGEQVGPDKYQDSKSKAMAGKLKLLLRHVEKEEEERNQKELEEDEPKDEPKEASLRPKPRNKYMPPPVVPTYSAKAMLTDREEEDHEIPPPPDDDDVPPPPPPDDTSDEDDSD